MRRSGPFGAIALVAWSALDCRAPGTKAGTPEATIARPAVAAGATHSEPPPRSDKPAGRCETCALVEVLGERNARLVDYVDPARGVIVVHVDHTLSGNVCTTPSVVHAERVCPRKLGELEGFPRIFQALGNAETCDDPTLRCRFSTAEDFSECDPDIVIRFRRDARGRLWIESVVYKSPVIELGDDEMDRLVADAAARPRGPCV